MNFLTDDETRAATQHALTIAEAAHQGQTRRYVGLPYVLHPIRVGLIYAHMLGDRHLKGSAGAACLLHDVIEDTAVNETMLRALVSDDAVDLVMELTDKSRPEDGNRAKRKEIDRTNLWKASATAQEIKCCDMLDNSVSIIKHDPDFARVYTKEKKALLLGLTKVMETRAWLTAMKLIQAYEHEPAAALLYWEPFEQEIFGGSKLCNIY